MNLIFTCIILIFVILSVDTLWGFTQRGRFEKSGVIFRRLFIRFRYSTSGFETRTCENKDCYKARHVFVIDRVLAVKDNLKALRIIFCYFSIEFALLRQNAKSI